MARKSSATLETLERIVRVMQARYADELVALADDGLTLAAPSAHDYYMPGGYLSDQIFHAPVAVVVQQSSPARARAVESGDGTRHALTVELPVIVRVLFASAIYTPLDRIGREQTKPEATYYAAERYKGALIETLAKYAPDGVYVDELFLTSDLASTGQIDEQGGLRGEAYTEWTIVQEVDMASDIRFSNAALAVANP